MKISTQAASSGAEAMRIPFNPGYADCSMGADANALMTPSAIAAARIP